MEKLLQLQSLKLEMKNSDLKKKEKKRFKMHIKAKETFPNMLRNCRFTIFTFIKKMVLK